jgi:uncharacterized surface anchored protein
MKDKVGPGDFTLANCGSILVNKFGPDGSTLLGGATIKLTAADNVDDANDDGKFDAGEAIDPDKVITMAEGDDGVFCSDGLTFGDYVVFETAAPAGYDPDTSYNPVTLSTFSTCAGRLGDSGTSDDDDPDVEITNNPEPGRITIVKEDDDGNVLPGVQFELFNDVNENDSFDEGTDTTTGSTCTTDSEGVCQEGGAPFDDPARPAFDQVDPGFYCVVEVASSIPSGYGGADPQCVEVGVESGGDTISLTFENPRLHRVIVIVCHQGTDTLVSTEVDDGTTKKDSIASGDLPAGMDEGDLCTLGGARYNGYDDDDTPSFAADMGTAHPH